MKKFLVIVCVVASMFIFGTGQAHAFLVEAFDTTGSMDNLAMADALITGGTASASGHYQFIDFDDGYGRGHFHNDLEFPGAFTTTFAVHVTGSFLIETAGTYTFGTNTDDGHRLIIGDKDNPDALITDPFPHYAADFFVSTYLDAGIHSVDLVFFERTGAAALELFIARGEYQGFNEEFQLLTAAVPEPGTVLLLGLGFLGLVGARRKFKK